LVEPIIKRLIKFYRKYQVFIGASFVLGLFLAFCLSFFMLHLEKKAIRRLVKQEILEGFEEDELVHLTFTIEASKQLEWEHAKEFKFNNQFYDVVRTKISGGNITYSCWLDKQETEVNKKLDHLIADVLDGMPNENQPSKVLNKLLKSLFAENFSSFSSILPISDNQKILVGEDEDLISLNFEPLVPPPNAA
jgi:hypothetical protein